MLRARSHRHMRKHKLRLRRLRDDFWCYEEPFGIIARDFASQIAEHLSRELDWTANQIIDFTNAALVPALRTAAQQASQKGQPGQRIAPDSGKENDEC
jgi:hypothetical protein